MNVTNFQNLIKTVEDADPKYFAMIAFSDTHGIPFCPLANYASRQDLQTEFILGRTSPITLTGKPVYFDAVEIQNHFDITEEQCVDFFDVKGCKKAKNPKSAAQYLKNFHTREISPWFTVQYLDPIT